MPLDITEAVKAIGEAFKSLFDFAKTAKTRQSETQIIKELKKLEKAVNAAEKMFNIFFQYFEKLSDEDKKEIEKLLEKFQENN